MVFIVYSMTVASRGQTRLGNLLKALLVHEQHERCMVNEIGNA